MKTPATVLEHSPVVEGTSQAVEIQASQATVEAGTDETEGMETVEKGDLTPESGVSCRACALRTNAELGKQAQLRKAAQSGNLAGGLHMRCTRAD